MGPELGPHKIPLPEEAPTVGRDATAANLERDRGVRGVRHLSNWTLAALVVGVGATSAVLARSAQPATSTSGVVTSTSGAVPSAPAASPGGAPTLHAPVTMTTPSGVVVQTAGTASVAGAGATSTVGGRRVVIRGDT